MNIQNTIYVVLIVFTFFFFACKKDGPKSEAKPPEYTKPGYSIIESVSVNTTFEFTDITNKAGIDFIHETGAFGKKWMPETMGSGGGFLDYNNDGLPDIFLVNSTEWPGHETKKKQNTPKLYRNSGNGKFEDVTIEAGLDFSVYGMGCAFADYDSDGDLDIYLTAVGDNKLLRNDKGIFTDVTAQAGVFGDSKFSGESPAWSTSAAWVDQAGS